jgi:glucokinase
VDPNIPGELCHATVDMLLSIFGGEACNLVLRVFAAAGVHMAEGIARHPIHVLKESRLMQAFSDKGRFQDLMRRIPVYVITARAASAVATTHGLETLQRTEGRA